MPKPKLPRDPLLTLEVKLNKNATRIGCRVQMYMNSHPGDPLPPEVLLNQRVAQDCFKLLADIRLAKEKLLLQQRMAAAKLPDVDQEQIQAEVDRLISDALDRMSENDFRKLMNERRQEDEKTMEAEQRMIAVESETERDDDE